MSIEFKERSMPRSETRPGCSTDSMSTPKQFRLFMCWVTLILMAFENIFSC
jgi:hypothetical protein